MCTIPAAMAGASIASTALQIQAQNEAAYTAASNAASAAQSDYAALTEQARQINQQSALEQSERQRQALRERGRLIAALSDAGIAGNSPMRELANTYQQEAFDTGILKENQQNSIMNNILQMQNVHETAKGRIDEAKASAISPALAALQITSSAISGYNAGHSLSKALVV